MRERMSVTVPQELIQRAKHLAEKEERTLSAMVSVLLRSAIVEKEKSINSSPS